MANADDLREELIAYDGRNTSVLSKISARHSGRAGFLCELADLASDREPAVSEAATWIIKLQLEAGLKLLPEDITRLIESLDDVTAWQAQLHVCQCIGRITVPEEMKPGLERWLETLLDAPRPFLRAWAVDGLCRLRAASPRTQALLKQMETDKAASVRARVRSLKAEFGAR